MLVINYPNGRQTDLFPRKNKHKEKRTTQPLMTKQKVHNLYVSGTGTDPNHLGLAC